MGTAAPAGGRSVPIRSAMQVAPISASAFGSASSRRIEAIGSAKLAVPICTAVAPVTKNSMQSSIVMMPPTPMIGRSTALRT